MSTFRDYETAYEDNRKIAKGDRKISRALFEMGVDFKSYESVYKHEIDSLDRKQQPMAYERTISELEWYRVKRPYFNVYPLIERKLMEITDEIEMIELVMPFPAIEVRTHKRTMLLCGKPNCFLLVVDHSDGSYQEFIIDRRFKLKALLASAYTQTNEPWIVNGSGDCTLMSVTEIHELIFLTVGVCMLAADPSIVSPVMLNQHRRDSMSPSEIALYAEKAVKRTGRIGFEVGREIERMKATSHYRNGHFAKFYVGKTHESYPKNGEADKVPIIKWRCGSVVNKNNIPKVPTGYKDQEPS